MGVRDHLHVREVAPREHERVRGLVVDHHRLAGDAELGEQALQELRLRLLDHEGLDDLHRTLDEPLAEGDAQRGGAGLLGHRVGVVTGLGAEGGPAVAPEGAARLAGPGAAGALLPPGLLARARDEGPVLGHVGAAAPAGAVLLHRLVDEVRVGLGGEDVRGELDLPDRLVRGVHHRHLRGGLPLFCGVLRRTPRPPARLSRGDLASRGSAGGGPASRAACGPVLRAAFSAGFAFFSAMASSS